MEITKISHGPPSTIVCKLMNLTEAFLTENHFEVRTRGRKEGHEIGNLELPLGDIWEIEASWWVGGGGGWGGWLSMPSHKSRYPLLLDGLQHEISREQLHKQSRPETASDYNVDKTTSVPSSRFEKTQTIYSWSRQTLCDSVYGEQE